MAEYLEYQEGKTKVKKRGIAGPLGIIIEENSEYIVIKIPGHSYWAGIGMTSYAKTSIEVYKKILLVDDIWKCEFCIEWETRK